MARFFPSNAVALKASETIHAVKCSTRPMPHPGNSYIQAAGHLQDKLVAPAGSGAQVMGPASPGLGTGDK